MEPDPWLLTYIGGHDAVEIEGVPGVVEPDEQFSVEDEELAKSLLSQRTFEPGDDKGRQFVEDLAKIEEVVEAPKVDVSKLNLRQLRQYADDHTIEIPADVKLKVDVLKVVQANVNDNQIEES